VYFGFILFYSFLTDFIPIYFIYFLIFFSNFFSLYSKPRAFLSQITFFVLVGSFFSDWLEMLNFHSPSMGHSSSIDPPATSVQCAAVSQTSVFVPNLKDTGPDYKNRRRKKRQSTEHPGAHMAWYALGHVTGSAQTMAL
jgi:hypothetical protein